MKWCWLVCCVFLFAGCASLSDAPRSVWGSSLRVLEAERSRSIYNSYSCNKSEAFEAVLSVAEDASYLVFQKNEVRGVIVLIHIPGAIDTTEVGVFITPLDESAGVKIEVSSRSSAAKRAVARALFEAFSRKFSIH